MNLFKTIVLMALLSGLMIAVGGAAGGPRWATVMLIASLAMDGFAYWFSASIVLRMYHAQEVTREEAPELYDIVALTVNLGIISSHEKLKFTINIRYPVTVKKSTLIDILDKCLYDFTIAESEFQEPLYVDKDDVLVKTLLSTYNDVMGTNLDAISIGGGTYARALKHGVAFGPEFPGVESTIHMPDERTPISTYMNVFKIYREAIRRLCF